MALLGLCAFLASAFEDGDNDGMDDAYESFFGLNTSSNDAALNYDGDSLTNGTEAVRRTDPFAGDTDKDGFEDGADNVPVSRAVLPWGQPFFAQDDRCEYVFPPWFVAGYKEYGLWLTNAPTGWHVPAGASNDVGRLLMEVDRAASTGAVNSDLELRLTYLQSTQATLFADLLDTNGWVVATNVLGDLIADGGQAVVDTATVPFGEYTNAAVVVLRRGTGAVTVYECVLYVDRDRDGLDEDQEAQLGTSDTAADSDGDGYGDWQEAMVYGTDPRTRPHIPWRPYWGR